MSEIVWLASYPKSGNTWTRTMIASYLVDEQLRSLQALQDAIPDISNVLRSGRMLPLDDPRQLVVKTHFLPSVEVLRPYGPVASKAVYLVRNPRDVIPSAARHLNVSPTKRGEFARYFIENRGVPHWREDGWGTWQQSVMEWTLPENVRRYFPGMDVLVVRYEDLRENPAAKLHEIVEFLDSVTPADPDRVRRAVENSSLERMRETEAVERTKGMFAFREPPRERFIGQGLRDQSLDGLGDGIDSAYEQLMAEDDEFFQCAKRFGYEF